MDKQPPLQIHFAQPVKELGSKIGAPRGGPKNKISPGGWLSLESPGQSEMPAWALVFVCLCVWLVVRVDGLWVGGLRALRGRRKKREEGEGRRKGGETGSGAEPRRNFLKTQFYPLSGPRWGLSFAFLYSSHRDLPFGETLSSRGRLDAEIGGSGQLRLGQRGSGFFNPDQTLAVYPTG